MRTNYLKCALVTTMLTGAFVASADAAANKAYVGAGLVYSSMKFTKDYGANLFAKNAPGLNVFAGYMFTDNFGLEAGYEHYKKKKKTVDVSAGERIAGGNALLNPYTISTSVQQTHPYILAIAKTNMFDENLNLGVGIGLSYSKLKAFHAATSSNGAAINPIKEFNYSTKKILPMVKTFAEYKFDQFAVEASLGWKNTSKLKVNSSEDSKKEIKAKNSFNAGLGIKWYVM